MHRVLSFLKDVLVEMWHTIKGAALSIIQNWEATTILVLASIGLTKVLVELGFIVWLPLWLEAWISMPLVAAVISTLLISLLLKEMEWRLNAA